MHPSHQLFLPRPRARAFPVAGLIWVLLAGSWGPGAGLALAADAPVSKEYQIKAAFLYNFTKFVEWPPARFADATSPIVLGLLGPTPLEGELEKIVAGRKVNGREIIIRMIKTSDEAKAAHVVFLGNSQETPSGAARLSDDRAAGVLTVGETAGFSERGGMIGFVLEGDKVRFEINLVAAERAGLRLNAQLLKLATLVRKN